MSDEEEFLPPSTGNGRCSHALVGALQEPGVLNAYLEDPSERQAPPPVHAPKGLRGIFKRGDSYAAYEPMDLGEKDAASVLLNVYDVGEEDLVQKVNRYATLNDRVLLGGVYHVGVQIYGREWGYGAVEEEGITGVGDCAPRFNWQHTYKCTIDLGPTEMMEEEVKTLLTKMARSPMWEGYNYDLLHHNCLHFANFFCHHLGVRRLPGWLDRFARGAVNLQNFTERAAASWESTQRLARGISTEFENTASEVRRQAPSVLEAGASTAQNIGFGLARWGQGLFAAASKAVGDDTASRDEKRDGRQPACPSNDLRASLRNRGGYSGIQQASSSSTAPLPHADEQQQEELEDIDAFLLDAKPTPERKEQEEEEKVKAGASVEAEQPQAKCEIDDSLLEVKAAAASVEAEQPEPSSDIVDSLVEKTVAASAEVEQPQSKCDSVDSPVETGAAELEQPG